MFGASQATLVEHGVDWILRNYKIQWKRQQIDYTELAKLRWVDRLSIEVISHKLGLGLTATKKHLRLVGRYPDVVTD